MKTLTLTITVLMLLVLGCADDYKPPFAPVDIPPRTYPSPITYTVRYEVSSSGGCTSALLTYNNAGDNTEQINPAYPPWGYSFTCSDKYFFLYISAQNNNSSGSVTTRILINGVVKKSTTSTGGYVIATAYCSLGDITP